MQFVRFPDLECSFRVSQAECSNFILADSGDWSKDPNGLQKARPSPDTAMQWGNYNLGRSALAGRMVCDEASYSPVARMAYSSVEGDA